MHLHVVQAKTPFSENPVAIELVCQIRDICPWHELGHSLMLQLGHLAMSKPVGERHLIIKNVALLH